MFRVSNRFKYGIRALIELAAHEGRTPVPAAHISAKQHIPRTFLVQILHRLRRAGLIESTRGPAGGFLMKKAPGELALGELVDVLEGRPSPVFCLGDSGGTGGCGREGDCFSRFICSDVDRALTDTLNTITLAKIVDQWKRKSHHA